MSGTPEKAVAANTNSEKGSPAKKEVDAATQALQHFAQGKRHLLINDINSAVNSLQEACRMLAEIHGETAPECGDAYFYYGRALLEMARIESGVLGTALDGEDGSTDDESQDGDSQDGSQDGESQGEGEETEDGGEEEKGGDEENGGDEEKEGDGEKTEEEEEDVSNLQLSWEMLELAKVIYQRQGDGNKAMSLKAAQVFLKLGEVALESENYPQSIEDFQACLKIQETHMEADDRCFAETHYQLGVAHSFSDDFDNSIESFTKAAKVIDDRIANLEKMKKEKEGWTEEQKKKHVETCEDPFYSEDSEIQELNNLLPEIKGKIVDMEEMKKDSIDKMNKVKQELGMGSAVSSPFSKENVGAPNAFGSSSSASGEAKPIATTMIRKKELGMTSGFGSPSKEVEGSTNAFGFSSSTAGEAKTIATTMIRKKRKPEDETKEDDASKKSKATNEESKSTENSSKNGNTSPEKSRSDTSTEELKKKAVEDRENKTKELQEQSA